jgi:sulfide:quinone oxidoreductase
LLLSVPLHKPPATVRESGLVGQSVWIDVNKHTLETFFADVYAIGDVVQIMLANARPLPKAEPLNDRSGLGE